MKKYLILILNIVLILAILGCVFLAMYKAYTTNNKNEDSEPIKTVQSTPDSPSALKEFTIGIILSEDTDDFGDVYKGFSTKIKAFCYDNNISIKYDYVLGDSEKKITEALARYIKSEYDLIVTVGDNASKLAASMTTDTPVVFAAVSEPEELKIVKTNEVPGGNVSGVSDYIPCFEQICSIKEIFPDCKRIGAIYKGDDHDSVSQVIMGEKEANRDEVDIPYSKYPVSDKDDIKDALKKMVDDGVEVIYAPVDSLINDNLDTVIDFANKHKMPIVCGNYEMFKKGCFSTSVTNYNSIGEATADMVLSILLDNVDTATLPVLYTYDCFLYINQDVIVDLDVYIPDDLKATAIVE